MIEEYLKQRQRRKLLDRSASVGLAAVMLSILLGLVFALVEQFLGISIPESIFKILLFGSAIVTIVFLTLAVHSGDQEEKKIFLLIEALTNKNIQQHLAILATLSTPTLEALGKLQGKSTGENRPPKWLGNLTEALTQTVIIDTDAEVRCLAAELLVRSLSAKRLNSEIRQLVIKSLINATLQKNDDRIRVSAFTIEDVKRAVKRAECLHDWNGCECRRCSIIREKGHDWEYFSSESHEAVVKGRNWRLHYCKRCGLQGEHQIKNIDAYSNLVECTICGYIY